MKPRLNGRAIFCLCLMAIAAGAFINATEWPLATRLFPMVVSIPLFFMAFLEFLFSAFGGRNGKGSEGTLDKQLGEGHDPAVVRKQTLLIFAWCAGFFLMVLLLGFSIAVPLFVFLYLRPYSKEGWGLSIVLTALAGVCFYGLFVWLLNVHFETGLIQDGLRSLGVI